ncbi:MAG: ATP-binding protein [Myxococcales bacterium]|nr:ATP-binding protein [Myxococcales bacterium]
MAKRVVFTRELEKSLKAAARQFGALVVTGPRRAGKTFLLQHTFPGASYHLLEDPDVLAAVKADPRGWLDDVKTPAIVGEIQNAPELFSYVRTRIDQAPNRHGQWLLTGSQDFSLMAGVTESMTGRAAVFQLLPLSYRELRSWSLLRGGFPEVVKRPSAARPWFRSYVQTYLERDVRSLKAVKDLGTFRRFLTLLASRNGQLLNRTELAAPLGVSVPTVSEWVTVLETTGHVLLVPPYFENLGKRLVKSPKVYWVDPGLLCFLLGIDSPRQLEQSPFLGSIFEGFIAAEIIKNQVNAGRARELYFFRDQQGLEVDFLVPGPGAALWLVEAKWSKTLTPEMALPLQKLAAALKTRVPSAVIVHRAPAAGRVLKAVARGVSALSVEELLEQLPA